MCKAVGAALVLRAQDSLATYHDPKEHNTYPYCCDAGLLQCTLLTVYFERVGKAYWKQWRQTGRKQLQRWSLQARPGAGGAAAGQQHPSAPAPAA